MPCGQFKPAALLQWKYQKIMSVYLQEANRGITKSHPRRERKCKHQQRKRGMSLHCTAGQQVHQECRHKYCAPNQIAKALRQTVQQGVATNTGQQVLRSAERQFNFSTDCFYCCKPATFGREKLQMLFLSGQLKQETNYGSVSRKWG